MTWFLQYWPRLTHRDSELSENGVGRFASSSSDHDRSLKYQMKIATSVLPSAVSSDVGPVAEAWPPEHQHLVQIRRSSAAAILESQTMWKIPDPFKH